MIIGDFNEILFYYEKVGGQKISEKLMKNFREALDNVDFQTWGM